MNAIVKTISRKQPPVARPKRQRGVVLFIALVVLVAMTLAGIALWRSVGTGILIAGNLAFQQGATNSGDGGIETARNWLTAQSETYLRDDHVPGYYANWATSFNPQTFDWANNATAVGTDVAGNTVSYVVHRLCKNSGESANAPTQQCVTLQQTGTGTSRVGSAYGQVPLSGVLLVYYRITARVTGPKNTVSYVQSVMY
jgi:Tfp pilus assembly protein PilX